MLYWLIFDLEVEPHLTFFYQELQTSEDWYATNLNPSIQTAKIYSWFSLSWTNQLQIWFM